MPDVTLLVRLKLAGPLLTRATSPLAHGVDAPMARVGDDYALPGTLVKGCLREAWTHLREAIDNETLFAPPIDAWLGEEASSSSASSRSAARMWFDDFTSPGHAAAATRHRVQIDPARGAAQKGALQLLEAPFASGQQAVFTGHVRCAARTPDEARSMQSALTVGLRFISSLGALRTAGFGRLLDVDVQALPAASRDVPSASVVTEGSGSTLHLAIRLTRPFCISRHRADDNLFESEAIIPGGVLKGALAATWRRQLGLDPGERAEITPEMDGTRAALARHFERVRVGHAVPVKDGQTTRPIVVPWSLVAAKAADGSIMLHDVARCPAPGLLHGRAPAFQIDWKMKVWREAHALVGWTEPERELRVRTKIDGQTRRAAEGQLFAYEMVVPAGFTWHARVDLAGIENDVERAQVADELASLLRMGLVGLGKTKVSADVTPGLALPDHVAADDLRPPYVVSLQTATLLCDGRRLDETSTADDLHRLYAEAWHDVSGGALMLKRSFARQRLAGGRYLHHRFRATESYHPLLLTEAGSVFVLEPVPGSETAAEHWLTQALQRGVSLPAWACRTAGQPWTWRDCPYVPENGFGELRVNLALHREPAGFEPLVPESCA